MVRPLKISYPGAFYHITSRRNEQKAIYKSIKNLGLSRMNGLLPK